MKQEIICREVKLLISLSFFALICTSCSHEIIDKPIPFDEERVKSSLEYMKDRYGIVKESPTIKPEMVVVHWTAINTFQHSYNAFVNTRLPESRGGIAGASPLNVAIHYLIDRDGTIYKLMPDTLFARHVIGLNHCAIGIENVGSDEKPLTKKQLKANTYLIKELCRRHQISYVIGHHEYTLFRNHSLWKEVDPNYLTTKTDPGDIFMRKLRKRLSSCDISGTPD